MTDSHGDGWNGNAALYVDATTDTYDSGPHAGVGEASTATFEVLHGMAFDLTYTPGSWNEDNAYTLSTSSGTVLLSNSNPSEGLQGSFVASCG